MTEKILFISPFANLWQPVVAEIESQYYAQRVYVGQLFREEVNSKTELGKAIKKEMDLGKSIGAQSVISLVKKRFFVKSENQILLDFPRTKEQSELLVESINTGVIDPPIVYIVTGTKNSAYSIFEQEYDLENSGVSMSVENLLNSYYGKDGRLDISIALIEKSKLEFKTVDISPKRSHGCSSNDV